METGAVFVDAEFHRVWSIRAAKNSSSIFGSVWAWRTLEFASLVSRLSSVQLVWSCWPERRDENTVLWDQRESRTGGHIRTAVVDRWTRSLELPELVTRPVHTAAISRIPILTRKTGRRLYARWLNECRLDNRDDDKLVLSGELPSCFSGPLVFPSNPFSCNSSHSAVQFAQIYPGTGFLRYLPAPSSEGLSQK